MKDRRRYLFQQQSGKCFYCTRQMTKDGDGPLLCTVDEKHPRVKGGRRTIDNQVAACKGCNNLKGGMSYRAFMKSDKLKNYLARQQEWADVNREQREQRSSRRPAAMAREGPWSKPAMPRPPASIHNLFSSTVEEVFGDVLRELRAAVEPSPPSA